MQSSVELESLPAEEQPPSSPSPLHGRETSPVPPSAPSAVPLLSTPQWAAPDLVGDTVSQACHTHQVQVGKKGWSLHTVSTDTGADVRHPLVYPCDSLNFSLKIPTCLSPAGPKSSQRSAPGTLCLTGGFRVHTSRVSETIPI